MFLHIFGLYTYIYSNTHIYDRIVITIINIFSLYPKQIASLKIESNSHQPQKSSPLNHLSDQKTLAEMFCVHGCFGFFFFLFSFLSHFSLSSALFLFLTCVALLRRMTLCPQTQPVCDCVRGGRRWLDVIAFICQISISLLRLTLYLPRCHNADHHSTL